MLFEFDDDQQLLRQTVRDVLSKECPPALVRSVADEGTDPAPLWRTYAGLGWTELTETTEAVELGILLEELGRATDPTPLLATLTWFAPLAPGVASAEQTGTAVFDGVSAHREPLGDGWILDGTGRHVLDGDRADWFAVVTDAGVFTVPAGEATVTREDVFDPLLHVADVSFWQVRVSGESRADVDVALARDVALTGLALTMVGACKRVLELTIDHVRTREQFGVPIGSFQAVKHKAVDMHVAIERAAALAYFAALSIAEQDPRRSTAAAMAKAAAGECTTVVFESGFQLFGGMGFTWENDLQFALKRALSGELLLGGADVHRARVAAALLDAPAATTVAATASEEPHAAAV
ncbi:acyl-CoA dehydrogenase family protein [Frankia sp. CNm7]|uniref:Acyl-CoA dehydrogenase family protein n=1 Tax=Frankia nepalensis TaxID=1836974 RepID=A0A937RJC1_9ACTN|nr:acyl-CoA dehydrogenase family protein [Frankia nepalensis]MBL7500949.1 acyl-CoA dehydrogenase family protein [Frankia nepalensis]MBL7510076.1 acyl-CoA dehydrogenase family protein [Frankia nepalensis]MBL7521737.1 acyl-CoA dehydrogenase family protein [Frankia nepalensis]MBL7633318.1 acyl-CoA dehydrogenase family protein [Frankia nepalensis]